MIVPVGLAKVREVIKSSVLRASKTARIEKLNCRVQRCVVMILSREDLVSRPLDTIIGEDYGVG